MEFLKLCRGCNTNRLLVDFYDRENNRTSELCKDCSYVKYHKPYYQRNKKKCVENVKKWRKKNAAKAAETREAYESQPEVKLRKKIRNTINRKVKTDEKLRAMLEAQFEDGPDGQNWDNYGKKWSITFIVPLKDFDLTDPVFYKEASSFDNIGVKKK